VLRISTEIVETKPSCGVHYSFALSDTLQQRLGRIVRDRREALGLTQEELGERCDLHRTYIGSIERGERNLSLHNIERIAHALGILAWELIRAAEVPEMAMLARHDDDS